MQDSGFNRSMGSCRDVKLHEPLASFREVMVSDETTHLIYCNGSRMDVG